VVREVVPLQASDMEKATVDSSDSRMQYIEMIGKFQDGLISIINVSNLILEER
jgi:chemotaxis signal transduction protein